MKATLEMIAYPKLVFDHRFYPRQSVDDFHVATLVSTIKAGGNLPPILVSKDYLVVDGWHRARAWARLKQQIPAEVRTFESEGDMFDAAVKANRDHGKPYDAHDHRRIIEMGMREFGLKEDDLVKLLRVPVEKLKSLTTSWAKGPAGERVALKYPVKHKAGAQLTGPQMVEIAGPMQGTSYGYLARRLVRGLELKLLPSVADDPNLWDELRHLKQLLARTIR